MSITSASERAQEFPAAPAIPPREYRTLHELVAGDDQLVARWRGTATARDGAPYVNEYAWVMTMANERVTRVVAYLDLVALDDLITRVPLPR